MPATNASLQPTTNPTPGPPPAVDRAGPAAPATLRPARPDAHRGEGWLLAAGLVLYLVTRLYALDRFPIYFFSDEAVQANLAARLLANGFRDHVGTLLPTYLLNDDRWNLGLSVYLQVPTVALFGKSVALTRAVPALLSTLAPVSIALALRDGFGARAWWLAVFVMAAIPTWFLHTRTGFEVVVMVTLYACAAWCYVRYRYRSAWAIVPTLVFAAAAANSYANGPVIVGATGALLLLSDLRYHLSRPRRVQAAAIACAVLVALPFIRFQLAHPDAVTYQLGRVSSYWITDMPLGAKLATFARTYATGFDPRYWFFENDVDLARHRIKGVGLAPWFLLPFVVVGIVACLRGWRSSAHRLALILLAAAPVSAALATVYVTRAMSILVPVTLLAVLGFEAVAGRLAAWLDPRVRFRTLAVASAVALSIWTLGMFRAALVDGPTWFTDYGLYGMQYGAAEVFGTIGEIMSASPDTAVLLSPDWTNNAPSLAEFFLPADQAARLRMGNLNGLLVKQADIAPGQVFVLPADEYERARQSDKLVVEEPDRMITLPDGRPGFYFTRMRYVDGIDAVFEAEALARQALVAETVDIEGLAVTVRHSALDSGRIVDLFDGNPEHLIRGFGANPLVLEFTFPAPREMSAVWLHTAAMNLGLKVVATPAGGGAARTFTATVRDQPDEPRVEVPFDGGPIQVETLRLELTDLTPGEEVHIHVRDVQFR